MSETPKPRQEKQTKILTGKAAAVAGGLVVAAGVAVDRADPAGTESPDRYHTYVVQPHDTLWSIAEDKFDGDPREGVWELRQDNQLDGTMITPGMVLRLDQNFKQNYENAKKGSAGLGSGAEG